MLIVYNVKKNKSYIHIGELEDIDNGTIQLLVIS